MKQPSERAAAARRNGARGGRPAGPPTKQVRIYASDAARLQRAARLHGISIPTTLSRVLEGALSL
jgi:hypothetical protein